ncbi:hypothetical protein [Maridesulfovibrio salexigens]|uniref:ATPase n=1 Tax=Maridesulfovibrio salexigens (strain ATCC 14822 / DSM 2638 / NCIMB 8403 / VKM B-1763) TaxID=526222 RepID=C6BUC2_MARSD|nr:hypothetical protein [Maridesulfovibrio salexigens]ACS79931.1 hypothetical protein Desal_1870 [Maridesulfovibrio salexigens DSM 2638]
MENKTHTSRCFFGCNSAEGFHSFFNFLPDMDNAKMVIVKGGPGTGKSTFIKQIGDAFTKEGYDLEYQHCSLDPESYDAVTIPEIKSIVVAATGHHVYDPRNPGAVDEILNLGDYWDVEGIRKHRKEIIEINSMAEGQFHKVYNQLKAARLLLANAEIISSSALNPSKMNIIEQDICSFLPAAEKMERFGSERNCFVSSITPFGEEHLADTIVHNNTQIIGLIGEPGSGRSTLMKQIGKKAQLKNLVVEYYHKPIDPTIIEHIHIPEAEIMVTVQPDLMPANNPMTTYNLADCANTLTRAEKSEISSAKQRYEEILGDAIESLLYAKNTHSELEQYYVPYMDFDSVNQKCKDVVESLRQHATIFN